MEDFPPNSHKAKTAPKSKPKLEAVVSADHVRRKRPPLGQQFKNTFFSGDARSTRDYVVIEVVVPMVKDLLTEAGQSAIERIVHGGNRPGRPRRGMGGMPPSGAGGVVDYRKPQGVSGGPRQVSRPARARHDFDDIVLSDRKSAEEVIERMFDVISQFEVVTLADLYDLVNIRAEHTDEKWGWTDLHGARVERLRSGDFLLDLPKPEPLT